MQDDLQDSTFGLGHCHHGFHGVHFRNRPDRDQHRLQRADEFEQHTGICKFSLVDRNSSAPSNNLYYIDNIKFTVD
jgi:hypothetical protein